jgi:hypothetical protein
VRFEPQTFKDNDLKLRQSKHIRLSHNIVKKLFNILYDHYLPKIKKLKNEVLKLRFKFKLIIW